MAVSPTAIIAPEAQLGRNVSIGHFTVIGRDVQLGDDCVVESHCVIGYETPRTTGPLVIGDGAHIRSHSVFYRGSELGRGLTTGHHVTVRDGVRAGEGVQFGGYADVQGDGSIGDHVRTQSSVVIGKYSTIGNFVWLFQNVVLTNDRQPPSPEPLVGPTLGDYVVVAAMTTVLANVNVGVHAVIGANSFVRDDVGEFELVAGVPARHIGDVRDLPLLSDPDQPAYPWTRRFHRGYPDEAVAAWMAADPSSQQQPRDAADER